MLSSLIPALYVPKKVAIVNWRLWSVGSIFNVLVIAGVVTFVLNVPNYSLAKPPKIRKRVFVDNAINVIGANESWCQENPGWFDYKPGQYDGPWKFEGAKCAEVTQWGFCRNEAPDHDCLALSEITSEMTSELFIATSYFKEVYNASTGTMSRQSFLIPGVEQIELGVDLAYQVGVPSSWYHSMMGIAMLPDPPNGKTIVVDTDGAQVESWMNDEKHGKTLKIANLLAWANGTTLNDYVRDRTGEFQDNQISDPQQGECGSNCKHVKARVTGLDMVINVDISNSFPDAGFTGPVFKLSVKALPSWISHSKLNFIDAQGSTAAMMMQGIRVTLVERGHMSWFQINQVIYILTLYSVWLSVPMLAVFYFAVLCLGTLSDVYSGFVYESVDLKREFNGVSSRMLEMTYGFHDLHDLEEDEKKVWAISRSRLRKRFDVILEHDENLDAEERLKFTNYVFDNCSSSMPSGTMAIHLEDYRKPHMTGESLLFDDVLQIVDSDRMSGNILERIFMDDSLKEFSATAEKAEAAIFGKVKTTRTKHFSAADSVEHAKKQAWHHQTIQMMGRLNTIARCAYGQEVIEEEMDNLEHAFGKMYTMCDHVQGGTQDR